MAVKKKAPARKKAASRGRKPLTAAEKKKRAASPKTVNRRSQATKKAPSARLKRRRKANKEPGYFPNPIHKNYFVVKVLDSGATHYYSGKGFTNNVNHAAVWHNQSMAKSIATELANATGFNIGVLTEEKK